MAMQENLLNQALLLRTAIHDWIPKRQASVPILRALAEKLMVHHNNVCKAKIAGSSVSVAGFALSAVGFGLSFVTFGASLILAGVGVGIGAVGGLTNAGSMIAEACIQKDTFDTAQKIIDDDREATEAIEKLSKKIGRKVQSINLENGAKAGVASAFILRAAFKLGARIAGTAASEGGETLFRGLSVFGRVAHIGGFAFSAVLLPVDIYTLVTSSKEIDASRKGKKDQEPEAVKKLRELANELEKNMPNENDLTRELDDFIYAIVFST